MDTRSSSFSTLGQASSRLEKEIVGVRQRGSGQAFDIGIAKLLLLVLLTLIMTPGGYSLSCLGMGLGGFFASFSLTTSDILTTRKKK